MHCKSNCKAVGGRAGYGPPSKYTHTMSHTTTKATKATTTNAKAVTMDAATVNATAAALMVRYKTISGLDGHAAALRDKYGPATWKAIRKAAQDVRAAAISDAATKAREGVFNYRTILGATYKALSRDVNFKRLCAFAKATYKGTDTDTAAKVVRDYAPAVDAATGAPLAKAAYITKGRGTIYTAYVARELTDADALRVLKSALQGLAKAATTSARKATDTAAATLDNKRTPGAVVGVFAAVAGDVPGTYKAGDALTPKAGTKATTAAKAYAAAIGKAVPDGCAPLAAVNADARRAHAEKAAAALARERAAMHEDAAAAGMATAPKGRKAPKTAPADAKAAADARAALAAVDAFLTAERATATAAAKAAAVTA